MKTPIWKKIFATENDTATALARLALSGVMLPHGLQKAFGTFGGAGFAGTMNFFTEKMHLPAPLGVAAILVESLGSLLLLAGLGSRIMALGIGVVIGTAALLVALPNGFFMNWFGSQKGEGIEYALLMIGLALVVVLRGGGAFSLDRLIAGGGAPQKAVRLSEKTI